MSSVTCSNSQLNNLYSTSSIDSSQSIKPLNSILKNTLCAFVRSQILFVAVRLNLFSIIDESPTKSLSYEELKSHRIKSFQYSIEFIRKKRAYFKNKLFPRY